MSTKRDRAAAASDAELYGWEQGACCEECEKKLIPGKNYNPGDQYYYDPMGGAPDEDTGGCVELDGLHCDRCYNLLAEEVVCGGPYEDDSWRDEAPIDDPIPVAKGKEYAYMDDEDPALSSPAAAKAIRDARLTEAYHKGWADAMAFPF